MDETILRYKYVPFNKGSLSIISEGTMKFTLPTELNDPFDCAPEIDVAEYVKHVSNNKELFKRICNSKGYSPAERVSKRNKILKCLERTAANDNFLKPLLDNVGICSLTRDPLNLLMWAHYAKDHTGFVVEFGIPSTAMCNESEVTAYYISWLFPLEVEYSDKKQTLDSFNDDDLNMKKQFLVKGIDWEYEKEERVIDNFRGPGIHPFDRNKILKSVIAGIRMNDENFKTLESTINAVNANENIDVRLYRAEPIKGEYGLYVPRRDDLCISD